MEIAQIAEKAGTRMAQASARKPPRDDSPTANPVLTLQQQAGNQAVQQLLGRGLIHPKLTISNPSDPEEQEADGMADRVMRMHAGTPISGHCSCSEGEEMCDECRQKQSTISRKASANGSAPGAAHKHIAQILGSSGQPLDPATRAFFEPRFGRDFRHVRVHNDAAAAESARSIQAHAYTFGHDIVFADGQCVPGEASGRRLLAHELAHVVQQKSETVDTHIQRQAPPDADTTKVDALIARVSAECDAFGKYKLSPLDGRSIPGEGARSAGARWEDTVESWMPGYVAEKMGPLQMTLLNEMVAMSGVGWPTSMDQLFGITYQKPNHTRWSSRRLKPSPKKPLPRSYRQSRSLIATRLDGRGIATTRSLRSKSTSVRLTQRAFAGKESSRAKQSSGRCRWPSRVRPPLTQLRSVIAGATISRVLLQW